ncbi:MAG: MaoC family dehydratase N-terminal domain-containing protein [Acidimicrobiia bacterium]|nr:MaoC family dehydratase N-terminal domain-containing protein [Acidimicrobiia bacterium]
MVDRSAIGATDEPFTMVVEYGKVREFARATKSESPEYLEDDAPVMPPTFLTTVSFWSPKGQSVFSKVKLDLRRLLHGGQEYTFHGPPPAAGTRLTVQTRVDDIYEKVGKRGGTMTFVITVSEFRDESGTLVAEARSTAIETGQPATTNEGGA